MFASVFRSPVEQGIFPFLLEEYGRSFEGTPLRFLPAAKESRLLIFAAIHGEETETTFLLSRALRMLRNSPPYVACVLSANPDGALRGTRANARGVDLNRNFPTQNWQKGVALSRLLLESPRITELSCGEFAGSEPETQALIRLIRSLSVKKAVALHSPFGIIDSETQTELSQKMEAVFRQPWQSGVGYPTPGSFGSFAREKGMDCVTVELPRESPEKLVSLFAEPLAEFLQSYTG